MVQNEYGPPDQVLRLAEIPRPAIAEDKVLVRVRAASVHADIWQAVTGRPYSWRLMSGWLAPEQSLALKPPNVTFEQASSVPPSGYIAFANLWRHRRRAIATGRVSARHLRLSPARHEPSTSESIRRRSASTFAGLPLFDIASGPDPDRDERRGSAHGIIAMGDHRAAGSPSAAPREVTLRSLETPAASSRLVGTRWA
jgi:hypothetical protein